MLGLSYDDRAGLREIPEGFVEVEGSRQKTRRPVDAFVILERADFVGDVRVVEPNALVIGTRRKTVLLNDPGEGVRLAAGLPSWGERFNADHVITFRDGSFYGGKVVKGQPAAPGQWSGILHGVAARRRQLAGADLLEAFAGAEAKGFTRAEIASAFGDGAALEAVREAAVETVTAHAASLSGRDGASYYRRLAESDALPGFEPEDLGPLADEVFMEEAEQTIRSTGLPELLDLVAELTREGDR